MIFCKELDLPPVPEYLTNLSLKIVKGETEIKNMQSNHGRIDFTLSGIKSTGYDRYIDLEDGTTERAANVERYEFTEEFFKWFEDNIYTNIRKCHLVQLSSQIIKNGKILQTHTDGPRGPFVLSYYLDTGGEEVDTIWYQQGSEAVIREPRISILYDKGLNEIGRFRAKKHTWTLMDTRVLHGIRFMTSPRIMISVGLYQKELISFLDQHSIENFFNLN
jgi:hypothetical protein